MILLVSAQGPLGDVQPPFRENMLLDTDASITRRAYGKPAIMPEWPLTSSVKSMVNVMWTMMY
ncbi:hypothetical protein AS888_02895 [Peribacillus simplex]|uniref:Uncharacterized protein n=1 Tax=Peribacillus simplex TaxID=1478 RepID=A0A109MS53_9BACI|nr:hypothetical protein AS888_02895 [Peribacillus simplex]